MKYLIGVFAPDAEPKLQFRTANFRGEKICGYLSAGALGQGGDV
jgi:hypothetical protein